MTIFCPTKILSELNTNRYLVDPIILNVYCFESAHYLHIMILLTEKCLVKHVSNLLEDVFLFGFATPNFA